MMGIVSVLLILAGLLMLFKPDLIWEISESWKSNDGTEPSEMYVLSTRIGGIFVSSAGIFGVVAAWIL